MLKHFIEINFNHLPWEENQMANALAILAAMFLVNSSDEVQPIRIRLKETLAHCAQIEDEPNGRPWYYDICRYMKDQKYAEHVTKNDVILDGDILYKKGKYQVLLRCVDASEARRLVEEIHEGICGTYANGHKMSR